MQVLSHNKTTQSIKSNRSYKQYKMQLCGKKKKEKKRKEIHTCVARGRYVALGIWGFITWVSFIRPRRGD